MINNGGGVVKLNLMVKKNVYSTGKTQQSNNFNTHLDIAIIFRSTVVEMLKQPKEM